MISIDTNVLLRYLLQDDKEYSPKANRIVAGKNKILVTDVVLAETLWTLKGRKYKLSKDDLLLVLDGLFKEPGISFEDGKTVWRALHSFRSTCAVKAGSKKKDADFSDVLILEKSKYDCDRKNEIFKGMYSFDLAAQQVKDIKKP
ncbi:hypothetical protein MNBD_GAMMA11-2663 [hydrothermal vent metagenome]|uniref:PIN domain-containing protein n=1 Tax=hydrothermal vent metagenome TaxID=652676 RepID=A0A3B0WZE6_9ZZZZ